MKWQIFFYQTVLTYIFGAQKNRLIDREGSFEYPQHMFWLGNKKMDFNHTFLSKGLLWSMNV